jgi:hypothetical protein
MTLDRSNHELKVSDSSGAKNPRVGKLNSTFEIPDAQARRRQQRLRFLRSRENQHRELADRLDSCAKGQRCKSEGDPVCAALYWHKVCHAVNPLLVGRSWTRALVVTAGLSRPYGKLDEIDLAAAVESVCKRFGRSGLRDRIIIGAIDISLYLKNGKIVGWQLHLDLLIEGNDRRRLQKTIEAAFPAEPTAPRPYVFTEVRDPEKTLALLYTSKFFRRSWYAEKRKLCAARLPLTAGDLQQLLACLGKYPIGARLVLNGLRWDGKLLVRQERVGISKIVPGCLPKD